MTIKKQLSEISDGILQQALQSELNAFYLYRHLSIQCQRLGLFGSAKYFAKESMDEQSHAKLIEDFFNDRGVVAMLPDIQSPDVHIGNLSNALQAGYDAELELGNSYNKWYQSVLTKDSATAQFMLQFIEIQRLSIGEYGDWLTRFKTLGGGDLAVMTIDRELGEV